MTNNAVGFLALFIALGGLGYAATGGFTSNGKLAACVNEEGRLKLVKSGERCKRGQKSVSWNQSGPAGAQGVPGAAGATGPAGGTGATGNPGAPAVTLWAEFNEAGKLTGGQGVTGVSGSASAHKVTFDRDISKCPIVATANEGAPGDVFAAHGETANQAGFATTSAEMGVTLVVNC